MATVPPTLSLSSPSFLKSTTHNATFPCHVSLLSAACRRPFAAVSCKATTVADNEPSSSSSSSAASGSFSEDGANWVPVVPLAALPKGERRVIIQDGETILLLWYKDEVFAIENRSPAEGAYTEGLLNAKLTQDGCIVCPTTDSLFDLQSGAIKEWYPKNPVLRVLTPALRNLYVYPAKADDENIYINMRGTGKSDASAEIVFSGKAQPGITASDVNVDEVRMVVDEDLEGFGFTENTELINGRAAIIGFLLLLDFELLTGKGLLKGTGFLDFIYSVSDAFKLIQGSILMRAAVPATGSTLECGSASGGSGFRRSGSPASRSACGWVPTYPLRARPSPTMLPCTAYAGCSFPTNSTSRFSRCPPSVGLSLWSVQKVASDAGMAVELRHELHHNQVEGRRWRWQQSSRECSCDGR